MVEYRYNVELEQFKRVDNRGPSLPFNIVEARRIESMMEMGLKSPTIYKKIDFVNDVSITNLRTFMSNLKDGNIKGLDEDYPTPSEPFAEITTDNKISALESRVEELEKKVSEYVKQDKSLGDKVKSWLKY